jgi:acyl-CoA reductase-like NAD-dependent aldehyde dehydrogenase
MSIPLEHRDIRKVDGDGAASVPSSGPGNVIIQQLFIDGRWVDGEGTFAVRAPWDGHLVGEVATARPDQVDAAIAAAHAHLAEPLPRVQRAQILEQASALIAEQVDELASLLSAEAGKPITAARAEVGRAIDTMRLSGEEARRIAAETIPIDGVSGGIGLLGFELTEPVGVVAAITPFNFPLNLVCHKLGPALAAGCPVVLKPSEKTPLSAGRLVALLDQAGLPAGMLNLVTGDPAEIVDRLLSDPRVTVINFTGSAAVGWSLKERSPRKRHVLELGSNTAMVVAADADLDAAAAAAVSGGFGFSGQACVSLQRVYVLPEVHQAFLEALVAATRAVATGDPARSDTVVGPLITTAARDRVVARVTEAVAGGASVLTGGEIVDGMLQPTLLSGVDPKTEIVREEIFGPVVSVIEVANLDAAIDAVNDSRFGLNTAIFTADLQAAMDFAARAQAGSVLINIPPNFRADNMPYGGVKDSGQGREGVASAVRELTERKLVLLPAGRGPAR